MHQTDESSKISAGPMSLPYPLPQHQTRPTDPLIFPYHARKDCQYIVETKRALTLSDAVIEQAVDRAHEAGRTRIPVALIPLVMDVEFHTQTWHGFWTRGRHEKRHGVTLQCRGITAGQDRIFAHPQHALYAARTHRVLRHPIALQESQRLRQPDGFLGADYMRAEGWRVGLAHTSWKMIKSLPIVQFAIYGHFLLAELYMIFAGSFLADIDARVRAREITMGRRLRCTQKRRDDQSQDSATKPPFDFISLPWVLTLGDWRFAVEIAFLDTAGLHGPISLDKLCENVGVSLRYKKLVKRHWITRMHELYWADPDLFDAYSLEDLLVYEALLRNHASMLEMYTSLGLGNHCPKEPKGTMGKFSQVCFQAMLDQATQTPAGSQGTAQRDAILYTIHRATANYLASFVHSTTSLLSKVEGGRCWCHRTNVAYLFGPLVDIDISSCYGAGLALQVFPLGIPVILALDRDTENNEFPTLRMFLEAVRYDLVSGLWHARVSLNNSDPLKHPQDFLGSWFDYKKEEDTREQVLHGADDRDEPVLALNVRSGCLKILRDHIEDAVITGDFLEWLDHVCAPAQREELLDRLIVKTALYYPKSDEKTSLDQLALDKDAHQGKNSWTVARINGRLRLTIRKEEYHGWYGLSLGSMGVTKLLELRKKQPKGTPLDQLLKLTINALYGDSVSQYFDTSNMCVGNNITARARAMAWYMEKGLHMVQTITDGGTFELNRIIHALRRCKIDALKTMALMDATPGDMNKRFGLKFAPLGDYDNITLRYDWQEDEHPKFKHHVPVLTFWKNGVELETKHGVDALRWIDATALAHLQTLFPHATVLTQFVFETKNVYEWGCFHGAANYYLHHPDPDQAITKMRSYERDKEYHALAFANTQLGDKGLEETGFYQDTTPARKHLPMFAHPTHVERGQTFVKETMLKDGEYRVRYKDPEDPKNQDPGGSIWKAGLFREFNLSQFHYVSLDQFRKIKAQWTEYKRKYGQYVEMLFLNDNETLNYQAMIDAVQKALFAGTLNLMNALDPHDAIRRQLGDRMYHPAHNALDATRAQLAETQGLGPNDAEDHDSHVETSWDHVPYELVSEGD